MSSSSTKNINMVIDDDDDDLEALRLAALQTMRPRKNRSYLSRRVDQGPFFRPSTNPNLIAIVPVSNNSGGVGVKNEVASEKTSIKVSQPSKPFPVSEPKKQIIQVDTSRNQSSIVNNAKPAKESDLLIPTAVKKESPVDLKKESSPDDIDKILNSSGSLLEDKLDFEENESEEDNDFISLDDDDDISLEKLMDKMEKEFNRTEEKTKKIKPKIEEKVEKKPEEKRIEVIEEKKEEKVVEEKKETVEEKEKVKPLSPVKEKSRSPARWSRSLSPRSRPRLRSPSPRPTSYKRPPSISPRRFRRGSLSPRRKSVSPRRSPRRGYRRSPRRSPSPRMRRSPSPRSRRSPSPRLRRRTPPRRKPSPLSHRDSPRPHRSPYRSPSPVRRKISPGRGSPRWRGPSPAGSPRRRHSPSPRRRLSPRVSPLRRRTSRSPLRRTSPSRRPPPLSHDRRPYSPSPPRKPRKSISPLLEADKQNRSKTRRDLSKSNEGSENEDSRYKGRKNEEPANGAPEKVDQVLEARKRKFESNNPVGGQSKVIRLKPLAETEINSTTASVKKKSKSECTCSHSPVDSDRPADKELPRPSPGHKREKLSKKPPKRKSAENDDHILKKKKISVHIRPTALKVIEEKSKRLSERQQSMEDRLTKEDEEVKGTRWKKKDVEDKLQEASSGTDKGQDLRAELCRRRAQRLHGVPSGPGRLMQNALEGVVKKIEKKEKSSASMFEISDLTKPKKKSKPQQEISKAKSKTRRVKLLRTAVQQQSLSSESESEDDRTLKEPSPARGRSILHRNQV